MKRFILQRNLTKFSSYYFSNSIKDRMSNSLNACSTAEGPVTSALRKKLTEFFKPVHIEVECESRLHKVPKDVEIHFRVQIVSDKFDGLSKLQRHRLVNQCLAEELETQIHALRIDAKVPSEFSGEKQIPAPPCGGHR